MRITTLSVAAALTLVSLGTALHGQRPDDQINPRSVALVQQGVAARNAGKLEDANNLLETALAVDPRNRQAFVVLAEVARQQGLIGTSIRYYREALKLAPDDTAILRAQGEAMMAKGATPRAKENLAKIEKICGKSCGDASQLAAVIAKGPPPAPPEKQAQASASTDSADDTGQN